MSINLAHAQIIHMLIVLPHVNCLCTYMKPTPTALLEHTKLQLSCIDCPAYLHACE